MCGFLGIIGHDDVAYDIYYGLMVLQHRGQDSTGIVTSDIEQLYLQRGPGLVKEFFTSDKLEYLKGRVGVGHVRYPTVGTTAATDAQPFITGHPSIGLAHNGNLVNYDEIKKHLTEECGRKLTSTCDAELFLKLLADEILKQSTDYFFGPEIVFNALGEMLQRLHGSYSTVAVLSRNGLLAFRDPNGLRPIMMGKREDAKGTTYAFASESVALDFLGFKVVKDLAPGEAVFVDSKQEVHSKIIRQDKRAHCMFEWVYFARPDSVIENKGVYETRLNFGKELAKSWKENGTNLDVVIPIPDSARTSALAFAEETGTRFREGLIKNRYVGRTFLMPSDETRENSVRLKVNPIILEVRGKKVGVLDDSIVRGTTSKKIVSILKKAGAKEVHFFSACPPIKNPCFYAIDFPTRDELIAPHKTVEEVRESIGADSLTYQTLEGLKTSIGLEENICTACLTGEYPTNVTEEDIKTLDTERKKERAQ